MLGTNIGAYVTSRFALQRTALGAGAGGNIGATDGTAFQRTAVRPLHISTKVVVGYKTTLASGNTLTLTAQLKDSPDGITYSNFGASASSVVTGLGGGPQQVGTLELDVNLMGADKYIRPTVTPVLSASGVDTAEIFGVYILGGGETVPPTESAQ
jgi:hypothetical protein